MNDTRLNRQRHEELVTKVDNPPNSAQGVGSAVLVTSVQITTYPTTANTMYAANPTSVNGSEVEGGAASYVVDTTKVLYAYNAGSTIPPVGSRFIVHPAGGRFVFRWDS